MILYQYKVIGKAGVVATSLSDEGRWCDEYISNNIFNDYVWHVINIANLLVCQFFTGQQQRKKITTLLAPERLR